MSAYWNKILQVDLGSGVVKEIAIEDETYRRFIGGAGIGALLLYERLSAVSDPLSPDNPLIIMSGPLTGSKFPGSATRFSVVALSPLTGLFGESSCGGSFGMMMKKTGIDGIIVTGAADKPVYIELTDNGCEIRDAAGLWGMDTYKVTDVLTERGKESGSGRPSVLCIGQAGENLVRFSCIKNGDGNAAGRCGLGAVMGSKKLKAVTARGSQKAAFANQTEIDSFSKILREKIDENMIVQSISAFGTAGSVDLAAMTGDLPLKNWSAGDWGDESEKINGPTMTDTIQVDTAACTGCPVACKRIVEIKEGNYKLEKSAGPEYETVAAFGSLLLNSDLASISKANELCNRYGMDTISCGATIAFMASMMEAGLISTDETEGLEFKFGDAEGIIKAVEATAHREGFGNLLAEGSRELCRRLGRGEEFLAEIKGMEVPMHDPRAFWGMALNYATCIRGACHVNTMQLNFELGMAFFPEIGIGDECLQFVTDGKAAANIATQNLGQILNSTCTCQFASIPYTMLDYVDMLNFATGFDYTIESMMKAGNRIWLLKRGINNILGATNADDRLPKSIRTPLEDGPSAGMSPDMEAMLKEFYEFRDIDESGKPSKKELESAGLSSLAIKLHGE